MASALTLGQRWLKVRPVFEIGCFTLELERDGFGFEGFGE